MNELNYNIEEEERIRRRKDRLEQMRREKKRQMKRRRRMKMLLNRGAGLVVIVLVMSIAVIAFKKKPEEAFYVQTETEENSEKKSWFWFQKEEKTKTDFSMENMPQANNENKEIQETQQKTKEDLSTEEEIPKEISFQENADTVSIYNEKIISTNAVLIDESTDTIVASKGAKERISPASMTKVLTILVAAEQLTEEQLNDTFVMTREITDYGYINDCSAVGYLEGEKIPVRDLFYGTILPSGSDAAVGLATYVAGSHEAFVDLMNEKLKELGIASSSHVTNCVGLYDENHYSTVYDMAVIMKAAVQNEFCKKVLAEHNYTTTASTEHPEGLNISNWFLRRIEDKETGGEVLCAKTGYVRQSKSCAVSYGTFAGGKPYICVTAGSSSSWRCIYDHVEIYTQYISS